MLDLEVSGYIPPPDSTTPTPKKKLSPFDFVKSITETKEDLFEGNESSYVRFVVNRGLSFASADCVFFLHAIEQYRHSMPDSAHYQYLLNSINKRKRYSTWTKKDTITDDVKVIMDAYGYSLEKALYALEIISDKALMELKEKMNKGGKK